MSVKNEGFLHLEFSMISSLNDSYRTIISVYGCDPLRHTFAKSMIAKDVNIVTVKELLGHANIQTTMIYTNPNQKEVQKAYLNAIK